ncbi:MAG: CpaF family protein [Eubacteriales bacterium]|nr:CpaF family protein [Eubacteriales bacterium]
MIRAERLYDRVIEKMDMSCDMEDEELQELIHEVLEDASKEMYIPLHEKIQISKELFNAFRKLDILQELIEDDEITEIMINGTEHIFLEKAGRIYRSDRRFVSLAKLEDVIQQIAAGANRYVNESSPIVDARLEDGSRVNVVLRPVALNGPIMTIRKFPKEAVTMKQLIAWGSISQEAVQFLKILVASKYNIFVSGGTGSGKTTFLNALSDYIPKDERIITIEDNAELQIKGVDNLVRLEARNANLEGEGAVTIRDLIKSALRMRPDRIIVGEVRGEETVDMISSAMLNGHSGSMSTGHANNPMDMLHRLETMMLMGIELPLIAIQQQIASALDIIVHLGRLRDKSRKVLEITEVLGYENGRIQLQTLYKFQEEGMEDGKIKGKLVKESEIVQREKLLAAGYTEEGISGGSGQGNLDYGDDGIFVL